MQKVTPSKTTLSLAYHEAMTIFRRETTSEKIQSLSVNHRIENVVVTSPIQLMEAAFSAGAAPAIIPIALASSGLATLGLLQVDLPHRTLAPLKKTINEKITAELSKKNLSLPSEEWQALDLQLKYIVREVLRGKKKVD